MNTPVSPAQTLPDGAVRVTSNPDRYGYPWYLIELGRARYVKRFNLSPTEAAQVVAALRELGVE